MEQETCTFCGHTKAESKVSFSELAPSYRGAVPVCGTCLTTLHNRTPTEWLRWIKRNNPEHWERVVDHHRLGSDELSSTIRRIRIE